MNKKSPHKQILVLFLLAVSACMFPHVPGVFASEANCSSRQKICFQWTFIANLNQGKNLSAINFDENNVLRSGDQLKTSFTLYKPCFLYFIHHGPGDDVSLIHPPSIPQEPPSAAMPATYNIPENNQWFALDDNAGKETFYLVAASMRLNGLESLLMDYNRSDASEKVEIGKKIIHKVQQFNQKSAKLTAAAERPVKIGGTVRGGVGRDCPGNSIPLDTFDSLMVSANDFYIKVITIDHK